MEKENLMQQLGELFFNSMDDLKSDKINVETANEIYRITSETIKTIHDQLTEVIEGTKKLSDIDQDQIIKAGTDQIKQIRN